MRAQADAGGSQSRRMSLIEAITNFAVGFLVALLTQIIVFPLFGMRVGLGDNLAISGLFSLASVARSYVLRRAFEAIRIRSAVGSRHGTTDDPCAAG